MPDRASTAPDAAPRSAGPDLVVEPTAEAAGHRAADDGAARIRRALAERGNANIVLATGLSQLALLDRLIEAGDLDWTRVTAFHLDEYVGLPIGHGASFRRYLWTRFACRLPLPLAACHWIAADRGDPEAECARLGAIVVRHPVDVAFVGIGENGHLAFNDPPADFDTFEPFLVVELDEACRRQQVGEGWFAGLGDVPTHAITMSIRQILASRAIVCTVPDRRKAEAVRAAFEGPVRADVPASALQLHADATVYLDPDAASLLGGGGKSR